MKHLFLDSSKFFVEDAGINLNTMAGTRSKEENYCNRYKQLALININSCVGNDINDGSFTNRLLSVAVELSSRLSDDS